MIKPRCDFCGRELLKFGALLFSPPRGRKVIKTHICRKCYKVFLLKMAKNLKKILRT